MKEDAGSPGMGSYSDDSHPCWFTFCNRFCFLSLCALSISFRARIFLLDIHTHFAPYLGSYLL